LQPTNQPDTHVDECGWVDLFPTAAWTINIIYIGV
jgi:hypothetical protein